VSEAVSAWAEGTQERASKQSGGLPALHTVMRELLRRYLSELDGAPPADFHALVVREVERPLLELVLERTGGNQSLAASWLGIHRATLRKKLREHGLNGGNGSH